MLSSQADSWENHCRQLPNLMSKASTLRELLKRGAVAPHLNPVKTKDQNETANATPEVLGSFQ